MICDYRLFVLNEVCLQGIPGSVRSPLTSMITLTFGLQ